ncbi:hypothetical protein LTR70_001599 [Exophiala xenobiotica]|uniref:Uncharacterized protein n=1 Tax=Lithohypha guttulata TaxID=1690604 RepID=A0ABR0K8F9_9EURO|nr:hypothetical protein LTR24_006158 [Lithohypha guttulata]KAK5327125.1 hypothetical protein LTR70_001599 [Exophiala xenobiotica]
MISVHTLADYQSSFRDTPATTRRIGLLSQHPDVADVNAVIFQPVQIRGQGFSNAFQTAEKRYHSPDIRGPSTTTRVILSAAAAQIYFQRAITREMLSGTNSSHDSNATAVDLTRRGDIGPSSATSIGAPPGRRHTAITEQATDSSSTERGSEASAATERTLPPVQDVESAQSVDPVQSIEPCQNIKVNQGIDLQQLEGEPHTTTIRSELQPATIAQRPGIDRGNLEVRIRSRGIDLGSGATESASSYDGQKLHRRDLGVQMFKKGRASSFMPIGSAHSLLTLAPGAESRQLARLDHRRLGFGNHVWFDFRNTLTGQVFSLDLPRQQGLNVGSDSWVQSAWISNNIAGLRDGLLGITPADSTVIS